MAHDKYLPKDFDGCLAHFIEECGEVLAAAGKTVRFGAAMVNPELPLAEQEKNIDWLRRELNDLKETIRRLQICIDKGEPPWE